jgi:hypothetical protein
MLAKLIHPPFRFAIGQRRVGGDEMLVTHFVPEVVGIVVFSAA